MVELHHIFNPHDTDELLRGWLLHAHKGRDRHDLAARRCDTLRYAIGVPTITLSAIVGTSVFSALGQSAGLLPQIFIGILSVASTVLAALQTFLDYPGRGENHRTAAAKYKTIIRELEQILTTPKNHINHTKDDRIDKLRERFDRLEEDAMPVVPERIYDRVEDRYQSFAFVSNALDLATHK